MISPESRRIGVTGASGFIGSHLVPVLRGFGKVITDDFNFPLVLMYPEFKETFAPKDSKPFK